MTAVDPKDERNVAEALDVRFERADVVPGVIVRWAIGLALVSIVAAAVAVWLLVFLRRHEEAGDPQRPALYFSAETRHPEGVRLQSKPFDDLKTLRAAVTGRQGVHKQVVVVLVAGGGGLGGPDRVQDGQVVDVGQGLAAGLGGGLLLAVAVQHAGQHGQYLPPRGGRCGLGAGSGGATVVAGELRGRARARRRVGALGRGGEHVGKVDLGTAAQRDISMLAILGADDHGQPGGHGAALGGVVGDRVAQFGIVVLIEVFSATVTRVFAA